jgi:hypothetical protein
VASIRNADPDYLEEIWPRLHKEARLPSREVVSPLFVIVILLIKPDSEILHCRSGIASMIIAFLTIDNREKFRNYDLKEPYFGIAPTALLEGFEMLNQGEKQEIGWQRTGDGSPC